MKKSKTKKTLIIIFVSIFIIVLGFFIPKIANKICYPYVKAKAVSYLCDKYDAEKSEFEFIAAKRAHIYPNPVGELITYPAWTDFSFEFKYKDRNFFVNRYEGKFYDDYQLEDIEKWCTEWLQNNVDENIIGIKLDSYDLLDYYNYKKMRYSHIFLQEDSGKFLNDFYFISDSYIIIYFDKNEVMNEKETILDREKELTQKLDEHFALDTWFSANITDDKIEKYYSKSEFSDWYHYYLHYRIDG